MIRCLRMFAVVALAVAWTSAAHATLIQFIALGGLTGDQEVPPVATNGYGTGIAVYDTDTHLLEVRLEWFDLLAPVTMAHIHIGIGPGTNGPIAIPLIHPPDPPQGTSGSFHRVYDLTEASSFWVAYVTAQGGTADAAREALLASLLAGHGYFNIHTVDFPAGEIRGDITGVVPEPGSLALVGLGLAGLAARHRRSKAKARV